MPSRASVFILLSSCMAGAWAAEPTGLERLAATLPGTWKTEGQTFDTAISKNGPQHYVTVRDCWRTDSAVKCVFIVNGVLEHYSIYSWDAANNLYQETPITGRGKQPEVHIGVKGNVWTYDQDTQDRDGNVVHLRIVRTYTSPVSADYLMEYSGDGQQWTLVAKSVETRTDAGK
jgi:hypothetical protein